MHTSYTTSTNMPLGMSKHRACKCLGRVVKTPVLRFHVKKVLLGRMAIRQAIPRNRVVKAIYPTKARLVMHQHSGVTQSHVLHLCFGIISNLKETDSSSHADSSQHGHSMSSA